MANILVKLDLMGEAVEGEILSKSSNISTNNVSNALTEPTERNYGFNGICIDKWKIGDDGSLNTFQGYNGYMFGATDENGELSTDLAFTIVGSNITNVTFYFDETAQQWATEAYIDGKKMVSDDHIWTFAWDTPVSAKTITFTKWHRPNYNACITHLDIILDELILGDKWIEDFDSLSQSVADNTVPNYGVLANTGNLTLNDVNGELKDYAEDGILKNSNYPLMIFANGKQIQYHISTDTEYDFDAMQLKIELSNDLSIMENIIYNGLALTNEMSAFELLSEIFSSTTTFTPAEIDEMCDYPIFYAGLNGTIKDYLQAINIKYPFANQTTLKSAINKICDIAQLIFVQLDNGSFKFMDARPIIKNSEINSYKVIPISKQANSFYPNIIPKNKFSQATVSYYDEKIVNESLFKYTLDYKKLIDDPFILKTIPDDLFIPKIIPDEKVIKTARNGSNFYIFHLFKLKLKSINPILYSNMKIVVSRNYTTMGWDYEGQEELKKSQREIFDGTDTFIMNNYLNFDDFIDSFDFDNVAFNMGSYIHFGLSTQNTVYDCELYICLLTASMKDYPTAERYLYIEEFNFDIICDKIYFENKEYKTGINNVNYIMDNDNEFLQLNTILETNNKPMYEIISKNILNDYKDGIINAKLTVVCGDYYDINGNKVIDWQKGEVLQVGDIVRVDKDNEGTTASRYKDGSPRYFRITGRNFRYDGVPLIDLELMEVKAIE